MSVYQPHQLAAIVTIAILVGFITSLEVKLTAEDEESADSLIQRVIAQTSRSGLAIRATREMRAGTTTGKHLGWMEVETVVNPSGTFTWNVIEEGGSERTRNKVFRELLEAEAQSWRTGARDAAALTLANYEFQPLPPTSTGHVQIRVKPRRADSKLIDGVLTVSPDGYPVSLEGTLAKSPSFWVKSVTVTKRYGRFAGVALPTTIESVAEVKIFGRSRFSMRYRYSEVNGRSIAAAVASARD